MLSVKDLSYTAAGIRILDSITFTLAKGDNTAIIGRSGSGKSALLSALAGSIRAEGSVSFTACDDDRRKTSAKIILYPGSCPVRESDSVYDTILSGRAPHKKTIEPYSPFDLQMVDEKIREFGLDDYSRTPMGSLPDALYKMALLAHYTVYEADLLCIDNPEEALDFTSRSKLSRALQKYTFRGERSVLFATNDLNFASHTAEHFLVLDKGKLVTEGGHEIFTEDMLRSIFGCEAIISKNVYNGRPEVQIVPEA